MEDEQAVEDLEAVTEVDREAHADREQEEQQADLLVGVVDSPHQDRGEVEAGGVHRGD